jgi:hypothetical protein
MTSMQAEMEKLTAMMTNVLVAQAYASSPQPTDTPLSQSNPTAIPTSIVTAGGTTRFSLDLF